MSRLILLISLVASISLASACGVNASQVAAQVATATVVTAASIALDAAVCGADCAPVCEDESVTDPDALPELLLGEDQRYDAHDHSRIGQASRAPSQDPDEDVFGPSASE